MILSKMKSPYEITALVLNLIASISQKIGEVNAKYLIQQNPTLRKQNQIKTIYSSLNIEGNTLSEEQITAIIDNKRVVGPEKDIIEALNALEIYKDLKKLKFDAEKDFLKAHRILMNTLVSDAGAYRTKGVGIVKGSQIAHIAPPAANVKFLMQDLFKYLKDKTELTLIKSCVFHYEMEFIHPFTDGNGRMGRLWQTLVLMKEYPLFEFLPFETLISKNQTTYYNTLSVCDKEGKSTKFIEFMLDIIDQSLNELLKNSTKRLNERERLEIFLEHHDSEFTRKQYMTYFPNISTATASRDLKTGVSEGLIVKYGDKKTSVYRKSN